MMQDENVLENKYILVVFVEMEILNELIVDMGSMRNGK
jgi:hypothetical protein